MKLGFLTVRYADRSLEEVLDRAAELGLDAVELATGNYPGDAHCKPDELQPRDAAAAAWGGGRADRRELRPVAPLLAGIDAVEAARELGRAGAIFHAHAKDTYVDAGNVRRDGVLDTKRYDQVLDRAWTFRTVGYGPGEELWRRLVSMLLAVG